MPQVFTDPKLGTHYFPDDATPEEIQAAVAQLEKGADTRQSFTPSPYGVGGGASVKPSEKMGEVAANVVRYGGPVAAGVATGGAGFIPAVAAGVASGALSELGAQFIEKGTGSRDELSGRDILAGGAYNAAQPVKIAGSTLGRFLANTAEFGASSELGRYIETGELTAPKGAKEWLLRAGVPSTMGGVAAVAGAYSDKASKTIAAADDIRNSRNWNPETRMGGVMLSEVMPGKTDLERNVVKSGIGEARRMAYGLDANLDSVFQPLLDPASKISPQDLAEKFIPMIDQQKKLQTEALKAADDAYKAEQAYQQAQFNLSNDRGLLKTEAAVKAMDAAKKQVLYQQGVERILGGVTPVVGDSTLAKRMAATAQLAKSADGVIDEGLIQTFRNMGVEKNTVVLTEEAALKAIKEASGAGAMQGNIARAEAINLVQKTFRGGALTLEGLQRFQSDLADTMAAAGQHGNAAQGRAKQVYGLIKGASENFIGEVYGEATRDAYKSANAQYANVMQVREQGAVKRLLDGDVKGLLDAIEKEGAGSVASVGNVQGVLAELAHYRNAIASIGDETSHLVANAFEKNVYGALREQLVAESLRMGKGVDAGSALLNMESLVPRLDKLRQNGFPVERLGLGKTNEIKALAAIASANEIGGISAEQLGKFVDTAAVVGADKATTQFLLDNTAREYILAQTSGKARLVADAEKKLNGLKADKEAIDSALRSASADPLVNLLSRTDLNLAASPEGNTKWISSLLQVGPKYATATMEALKRSGRTVTANQLKTSALAEVFGKYAEDVVTETGQKLGPKLDSEAIRTFFKSKSAADENARATFRALFGDEEWANIKKVADTITSAAETQNSVAAHLRGNGSPMGAAVAASTLLTGGSFRGAGAGMTIWQRAKQYVDAGRYNLAYSLFVEPRSAKAFEAAGYSLENFVTNRANSVVLQLANQRDQAGLREKYLAEQDGSSR